MIRSKFALGSAASAFVAVGMAGVDVAAAAPAPAAPAPAVSAASTTSVQAAAAKCTNENWKSTLAKGSKGSGVKELQLRISGFAPRGEVVVADGVFGSITESTLKKFQKAYGLSVTGKADSKTFSKVRSLTKSDCMPLHFTYTELSPNCGKGFTGNATQKANLRRMAWQAEGLRKQIGDKPLKVSSGFRDPSCNASVKGAPASRHLTGNAIDFVPTGGLSMCGLAKKAEYAGFGSIFGPGYPAHDDHIHVDITGSKNWSYPSC